MSAPTPDQPVHIITTRQTASVLPADHPDHNAFKVILKRQRDGTWIVTDGVRDYDAAGSPSPGGRAHHLPPHQRAAYHHTHEAAQALARTVARHMFSSARPSVSVPDDEAEAAARPEQGPLPPLRPHNLRHRDDPRTHTHLNPPARGDRGHHFVTATRSVPVEVADVGPETVHLAVQGPQAADYPNGLDVALTDLGTWLFLDRPQGDAVPAATDPDVSA